MSAPITILLVDDEPRNLDALEVILDDPGYRLVRAEGADRALKALLDNDVAAIVLDIRMPGINGFELAQLIKGTKKFRQIPIVFLTAHMSDDQDRLAGYGAGAVDYLTKPVNPAVLRQKISVFAELFRKTRALAELNETLEQRVRQRTAELERSEAALKIAARQKDEFLAILAHELRNPLAPLRTGLDLVLQVRPALPGIDRTLESMNRQLDHMVRLIDDLLDVSRIDSGKLELKKERVDLATLIERAIDGNRTFFDRRGQRVAVDVPRSVTVVADGVRVVQILGNILHNASKFAPEGGTIGVQLSHESGTAVVRITDGGVGIPPDQLERIFDMFAHIERPTAAADRGLGIGLALARNLAQMHGGTLVAHSAGEGRGSTFSLALPVFERVAEPASEPVASRSPPVRGHGLDIVLVEDNEDNLETLATWLRHAGHRVSTAADGSSGVELIRAAQPDLVLCDIGLPGMDGYEVCRTVRSLPLERQPVMIALTGWGRDEDRRRSAEAQFDDHLVKPLDPRALAAMLDGYAQRLQRPVAL
jgi:CheY-like chemotaxis protein/nitrogen-specific signal transduction histidine kinase